MLGTKRKSKYLVLDGTTWMPVREAAMLIASTPATVYNKVEDGTIAHKFIGESVLLVSREDALKYEKTKKAYFKRFRKTSSN